eukprot:CAMPEP_0202904990 /NCGR_PEP_ID=MMETSP1392-20130828/32002_1 /ASSEMBLY_ACC=CAM_ASM_000868 /TAXON_ID=225041 /ORGANISM="Chlamydomonas chlamydogama, Strain SAG 11-48b" /LENGTH=55 /DNA_ID=CAMNT_0049592889 /DNA_START=308 /DNA_END=475 /DNA_ORIENTATION=+
MRGMVHWGCWAARGGEGGAGGSAAPFELDAKMLKLVVTPTGEVGAFSEAMNSVTM